MAGRLHEIARGQKQRKTPTPWKNPRLSARNIWLYQSLEEKCDV